MTVKQDSPALLPMLSEALQEIFKTKSPFMTVKVMDVLFNGIFVDCGSTEFPAGTVCELMKSEGKGVQVVNVTHFKFSLFGTVKFH